MNVFATISINKNFYSLLHSLDSFGYFLILLRCSNLQIPINLFNFAFNNTKSSSLNIRRRLISSEFIANTATLIGGTTIAQALPILFAPVISRLFEASDFSVYGVFVSIYAILASVYTFRYDLAVMIPKEDQKAKEVVALCLSIAFVLSLITFVFVVIFHKPLSVLFHTENAANWLLFIPFAALFLAINNVLITWYNRNKQYKTIAANKIIRNTMLTSGNLGFGFAKFGYMGLVISQVVSDALAAFYYLGTYYKNVVHGKPRVRFANMKQVAIEHIKFPKFTLPATFIDTFSAQLPILLIAALFGQSISGNYFFAYRILVIPIAIIGAAYAQTFYQKFVYNIQNKQYISALSFLKRSWLLLASLVIVPAIMLHMWGEPIFTFLFGNEWSESGKMASILIIYIVFAFISSPTSSTYIALGLQKYSLFFSVFVLAYRFGTIYAGYVLQDFYLGLILLVCFETAEIVIYNSVVMWKLKKLCKQIEK
jgi:O-antigen/teichoic acid export membrane protein